MKQAVFNLKNESVGEVDLPDKVFGAKWNERLVHQILLAQMANARRPWAHAKDRSEVRGGGRKPWRQKGTGRARHGSIRSPLWIGGGKAHGPLTERDYSQKVNKKMRRLALFSALSKKLQVGEIKVFSDFGFDPQKTKTVAATLKTILGLKPQVKNLDTLLISKNESGALSRIVRNLPKTKMISSQSLNIYDLLNYKYIFIEKEAIPEIIKHYQI